MEENGNSPKLKRTLGPLMLWRLGVGYEISVALVAMSIYNPLLALIFITIVLGSYVIFKLKGIKSVAS